MTHWGRVTHICVSELTIVGSDNGLSPGRRQAIIWTNDGILLIGPLGTNFSEILFGIQTFSFNKMHLKMSSAKWRPFCLGLNVLNIQLPTLALQHNTAKFEVASILPLVRRKKILSKIFIRSHHAIYKDSMLKSKFRAQHTPFITELRMFKAVLLESSSSLNTQDAK